MADDIEIPVEETPEEAPKSEEVPSEVPEETPSETDEEKAQKEVDTLNAQRDHWKKKYQDLAKTAKANPASETKVPADDEFRSRVEFLLESRDVNAEEYDHLAAVALRNSGNVSLQSLRDAKRSETEYISFLRKKAENSKKIPGSTSASALTKIQKSAEEIAAMTPAQHQKYEEQMMRAENQGI